MTDDRPDRGTAVRPGRLRLRDAQPDDALAVARVRVAGWRAAYRGLLEDQALARLDPEADAERWRQRWGAGARRMRLAELGVGATARVVGFASSCPYRRDEDDDPAWPLGADDGELAALYVDPSAWSRGVGSALLHDALSLLRDGNHPVARLWVLRGNTRTCRFYERAGFRSEEPDGVVKPFLTHAGARPAVEVRYRRDLAVRFTPYISTAST